MAAQDYTSVVQQLYISYFGRPADYYGLQNFSAALDAMGAPKTFAEVNAAVQADTAGTTALAQLVNSFNNSAESVALYGSDNSQIGIGKFVNAIYHNVLGRDADLDGFNFWVNAITSGTLTKANAAASITQAALDNTSAQGKLDALTVQNKLAVATSFTTAIDTPAEITAYAGDQAAAAGRSLLGGVSNSTDVTAYQNTVTDTLNGLTNAPVQGAATAFTKGLDTLAGTGGNDIFSGSISASAELNTVSGLDVVNGGAGIDTVRIADETGNAIALPTLSSVEVVEVSGTKAVTVDTTATTGVTNLNVLKAGGTVTATAGATTDVGVTLKDAGAAAHIVTVDNVDTLVAADTINVVGGNNVNVNVSDAHSAINVGVTGNGTDAAGNVTIVATGAAAVNNATAATTTNVAMGDITVEGGKVISVTQKATSGVSALVADGGKETVTQGDVHITATAVTTDVTVKQDADVTAKSRAAVAGATEVASVKFTALKATESVTVGGLTFTAAKDLTAAEVAQAFTNLSASAIKPNEFSLAPIVITATGDTQGSGISAKGVYTGALLANWSTTTATDDTVIFTGKANTAMADLELSTVNATATTTTQGLAAVSAQNTLGVATGVVTIDGSAALKTVTIDGYTSSGADAITSVGAGNTALATVTLSNGGDFAIGSAASTLALNLTEVDGTVSVGTGATKTINATINGDDVQTTLISATATAVNVAGTGNVAGTTATGGLAAATSINTSGMTAGTAEFTIADGTTTTYTGGAGSDTVTIANAETAISKAVDLGAGDDKLVLTSTGAAALPTATLSGGAGVDTIAMNGASAAAFSANATFAGKIDGFEKLEITDKVTTATTVNMANMDGINYVVSNNSAASSAAAVKEVFNADFASSGAVRGGDTITFDGLTITLAGGETAAQIAAKFINQSSTHYIVTGVNGSVVTFQAQNAASAPDVKATDFAIVDTDATTAAVAVTVTTPGDATTNEVFKAAFGGSGAIEDADTIVFDGVTITLSSDMTPADIAAAVAAKTFAHWTAVVDPVTGSTVDFTAKDFSAADAAASDFAITNVKSTATAPAVAVNVTTHGADVGNPMSTLTLDKMANNSTLELVDGGAGVTVKMADATGTADSFNIVTTVDGDSLNFGTVNVAGVETITLNAGDLSPTDAFGNVTNTASLNLNADKAALLTVSGNSNITLGLTAAATPLLATIDATALTGKLAVAATGAVAMTITGGSAADTLYASVGTDAKADVINGGAGNDIIGLGSNGAKVTGGDGNDLFILNTVGNKQANTYSEILDFKGGDLLQLGTTAGATVAKLGATLNDATAQFSDFVNAAVKEGGAAAAVWFNYKGDTYVVVDHGGPHDTFVNGVDSIVKLTGIDGSNLSFNADFGTLGLV
ncbi:hypothetical protein AB595_02300 [Massilia sp. WF1]|uniref:beta strand repeat-containing protein n=1 Tax=unclassified Massilia TaxID=2609279 RepID=UPI00064AC904|nr:MULTISPECIES: DUF4214 domain-containing protein [unclassified Massilia]ALK98769.1 hypothetical protein AM586_23755 [Massilia sp. WG5]KLU38684.1 hypothetical protein AB595_02300 [Massilia sp. WF1]